MSTHSAAEKAAQLIAQHGANAEDVERHPEAYKEAVTLMAKIIQATIDAATADKQVRIEKLEAALIRAIRALRFVNTPEGVMCVYSSLADQLDVSLAQVEKGGDNHELE